MSHKKPMDLKNLPKYLNSVKDDEGSGSPVVGMGQIVTEEPVRWFRNSGIAMLLIVVLTIGGATVYNLNSSQQFTYIVDFDSSQSIPKIVTDSGGEIVSVEQNEDSTYKVKVSTRKSKFSFLEWLRNNRSVKKAELE